MLEGRWEWRLILAVVAFAEEVEVEDFETVCLEAVGMVVVVEEEEVAAVEPLLLVADAAHTAVAVLETAEALAMAAVSLLVSAAERAAYAVRDAAPEGLYELPPPRPPAEPDGVAAPAGAGAEAEPLVSEPASPFPSLQGFWWEHSDQGIAPARRERPSSRCPPRR